jgi:peptidoglycan/LPS O-acetylase OafA/YrhL
MNQLTERPISQRLHLHYLDGLRGIAPLYVVFVHVEPSIGENLPIFWLLFQKLLRYGGFSVVIANISIYVCSFLKKRFR